MAAIVLVDIVVHLLNSLLVDGALLLSAPPAAHHCTILLLLADVGRRDSARVHHFACHAMMVARNDGPSLLLLSLCCWTMKKDPTRVSCRVDLKTFFWSNTTGTVQSLTDPRGHIGLTHSQRRTRVDQLAPLPRFNTVLIHGFSQSKVPRNALGGFMVNRLLQTHDVTQFSGPSEAFWLAIARESSGRVQIQGNLVRHVVCG